MSERLTVVLCEARHADDSQRHLERELADRLAQRPDVELAVLPHLYDLAPGGPAIRYLKSVTGDLAVLGWLYPRAAFWVLRANGIQGRMAGASFLADEELEPVPERAGGDAGTRALWCVDLRPHRAAEPILNEIRHFVESQRQADLRTIGDGLTIRPTPTRIDEAAAPRWYPVIDYSRCGNCLECLNFCLFGAYGLDEAGRILVEQPDACRDGCPACARICPADAILFPECDDPVIAGGPPKGDQAAGEPNGDGKGAAQSRAEAERQHALSTSAPANAQTACSDAATDLDRLVDELDGTEL